jgi:hypothetical protein
MVGEGAMADWSAVYLKQTVETSEALAAAGYAAFSISGKTLTANNGNRHLNRKNIRFKN